MLFLGKSWGIYEGETQKSEMKKVGKNGETGVKAKRKIYPACIPLAHLKVSVKSSSLNIYAVNKEKPKFVNSRPYKNLKPLIRNEWKKIQCGEIGESELSV